ncbi:hypothetical protein SAMN05421759_105116 [Roseivivax lentus]|uniref:STAS domain-containing protein n=1 Tax=Roseivivax lentus TaxID=633194 RepID=A0A1N7MS75_9RHOB|nr:hypothetical protein [Roseivivax lentus]SIS88689.1 hypothetical protein SAMN05421759_105116 [Roseivivax lentus]
MPEVIDLPDRLDTSMADGLTQRLGRAAGGDLLIDGQRVQCLGTLCAQALLAAQIAAAQANHEFRLIASEAMRDDLRLLGLGALAATHNANYSGETT